jgi:hypothetical protein
MLPGAKNLRTLAVGVASRENTIPSPLEWRMPVLNFGDCLVSFLLAVSTTEIAEGRT